MGLSTEDRESLKRSTTDLSDIPEQERRRIQDGFDRAARRAAEIRLGLRPALCGDD